MDDVDLQKLLDQDECFDRALDATDGDTNQNVETNVDDGLRLLHRIRRERSDWPLGDPQLDDAAANDAAIDEEVQWGSAGLPQTLGRFQIQRELGRGGFGVVLQAHDPKLQQDVALKLPRAESLLSDEARQRMAREARAATILAHPAIVPVYEVGNLAALTYISYGLCRGDSLADWLADRPDGVAARTAAKIVARLAEAIQHAHARQIIHRDLKPANILLEQTSVDGSDGLIEALRISDFGLAKLDAARSDISRLGTPLGTPAYMSPEQTRGEANVSAKSDIFSLGVILYELLTGDVPLRRENDLATLRAIETEPLVPVGSLNRTVPKDLSAICEKCLEKRPADRYATAQSLCDDLQRFLTDQPVLARPVGAAARAMRWSRRNPALSASLAALILVLATATILSTAMWRREQTARAAAEHNQRLADESAAEARQKARNVRVIVNEMLKEISQVPSVDAEGLAPFREKLLASFYEQIRGEDSTDPQIQNEYLKTLEDLATIHRMVGNHQQAAALWQDAIDYVKKYRKNDVGKEAYFISLLSGDVEMLGDRDRSVQLARDALQLQRQAVANNPHPHCVRALIGQLANLCETIDQDLPSEANALIDEAIALAIELHGKPPSDWPAQRFWNAILCDKVKTSAQLEQAEQVIELSDVAIEHIERSLPHDRSYCLNQLHSVHSAVGYVFQQRKDFQRAQQHYQTALKLCTELAERHPDIGLLQTILPHKVNAMAEVLVDQSRDEEARALLEENRNRIAAGRERFPECESEWAMAKGKLDELLAELP